MVKSLINVLIGIRDDACDEESKDRSSPNKFEWKTPYKSAIETINKQNNIFE